MAKPIRVLVVDDSALARQALTRVLGSQPDIEVLAAASDPFHAARILRDEIPDVIVLDIEMPKMDGITFLRKLMRQHPIPTVICSSLAEAQSTVALAALEAGAVDLIPKLLLTTREAFEAQGERIADVVRAAAKARVRQRPMNHGSGVRERTAATEAPALARLQTSERVVAVGASTGGTDALRVLLQDFGPGSPGVVIVQHIPAGFSAGLARRLDQQLGVIVREARDGEPVLPGHVLIAPGDRHMVVRRSGARLLVRINDTPQINRHRPSVDVLFDSVAEQVGPSAVGVILTGMGDDGARGLLRMRTAGAFTLAQDEESCIVYGMPKEAVRIGAACEQLPLDRLGVAIHLACAASGLVAQVGSR